MRKSTTDLSESELLTLKCIWDAGRDLSAAEIRETLKANYDKIWEPPTVCTFLARIESKGYISVRRKPRGTGKGYLYHPLMDESAYREQLRSVIVRIVHYILCGQGKIAPRPIRHITAG